MQFKLYTNLAAKATPAQQAAVPNEIVVSQADQNAIMQMFSDTKKRWVNDIEGFVIIIYEKDKLLFDEFFMEDASLEENHQSDISDPSKVYVMLRLKKKVEGKPLYHGPFYVNKEHVQKLFNVQPYDSEQLLGLARCIANDSIKYRIIVSKESASLSTELLTTIASFFMVAAGIIPGNMAFRVAFMLQKQTGGIYNFLSANQAEILEATTFHQAPTPPPIDLSSSTRTTSNNFPALQEPMDRAPRSVPICSYFSNRNDRSPDALHKHLTSFSPDATHISLKSMFLDQIPINEIINELRRVLSERPAVESIDLSNNGFLNAPDKLIQILQMLRKSFPNIKSVDLRKNGFGIYPGALNIKGICKALEGFDSVDLRDNLLSDECIARISEALPLGVAASFANSEQYISKITQTGHMFDELAAEHTASATFR